MGLYSCKLCLAQYVCVYRFIGVSALGSPCAFVTNCLCTGCCCCILVVFWGAGVGCSLGMGCFVVVFGGAGVGCSLGMGCFVVVFSPKMPCEPVLNHSLLFLCKVVVFYFFAHTSLFQVL